MNTRKIWLTFLLCLMAHLVELRIPLSGINSRPTLRQEFLMEKYMFTRRTTFPVPLNG